MLRLILERADYSVVTASNGLEGLDIVGREPDIRIVLCDLRMPGLDGMGFLEAARKLRPELLVLMMSAYGTTDTAIEAVKRGAYDFVSKPFRTDEILLSLRKVEEREKLARENEQLRAEVVRQRSGFIGISASLRALTEAARKVASSSATVLITGESGVGKDVLARLIQSLSPRAQSPFIAINCGAIPENLLESELFGHERGAFTGATRTRQGLLEQADGGTLLLDEIGEMPLSLQVKLLRALEEARIRRLGGERDLAVDVRILAATSRNLEEHLSQGLFREDLFYRLNVVRLHVPPLRERPEDIPVLLYYFLSAIAERQGIQRPRVTPEAMRVMETYPWPGNVRQLENACERAMLLGDGELLLPVDLPPEVTMVRKPQLESSELERQEDLSLRRAVCQLEREYIAEALRRTSGNRSHAARLLDISYKAIVYKTRDYGL